MKKGKLLVALVMMMAMLITGCGKEEKMESNSNSLMGKWSGTLDYTETFTDLVTEENAEIEKFLKFDNLTFSFVFEFSEDKLVMHVDKESAAKFVSNAEVGIANMVDAMVADEAAKNNITADDIFAGMETTRDAYIADTLKSMNLEVMVNALADALELQGTYEADENSIVVAYDDKTYESMEYTLNGEELTIRISDGTKDLPIKCTKTE